jgi:tetratricopeptide (TPR) repeat protein
MQPFNKILSILFFATLITGVYACLQDGKSANSPENTASIEVIKEVPELLDRNENIRYGKEWETVQNAYGKARQELMKNPEAKAPWLDLAEVFIQEARVTGEHPHYYPAALKVLDIMLKKEFKQGDIHEQDLRFRALSAKAGVQLSLHEFAAALETGNKAVALNPYNAAIYGVLVDANVELGNYEEAVKMADKMVEIRPDLRSYSRVSYLREIHGDVKGAIEAMQMAVSAGYPGSDQTAWTRLTLGNLLEHYGYEAEAKQQYEAILEERTDFPFALGALADLEIAKKNYKEAEALLQKATGIIPEVSFFESLAKIYKETSRTAEFEKTLKEVIAMMKDDEAHGHNMDLGFAHVYLNLANDADKALEYAMKEYQNRPENIDVNGTLAEIFSKKGDMEKMKMHLQKAMKTGSKNPDWLALR